MDSKIDLSFLQLSIPKIIPEIKNNETKGPKIADDIIDKN